MTLPKFIDAKKPNSRPKYHYSSPEDDSFESNPHDFKPVRGSYSSGRTNPAPFSSPNKDTGDHADYAGGLTSKPFSSLKSFADYLDPSNGGGGGPKSFMTISNIYDDAPDGRDVISIDHGEAYQRQSSNGKQQSGYSPSPRGSASRHYRPSTYAAAADDHDDDSSSSEVPFKLRDADYLHHQTKPKGFEYDSYDQNEPSSSSINYKKSNANEPDSKKSKAYWRMSYLQKT